MMLCLVTLTAHQSHHLKCHPVTRCGTTKRFVFICLCSLLGNKDWKKIHKKNFSKFDSIDVYLDKKRKRADEMMESVSRAKTLLEEVHSAANKLKAHKTPQSMSRKVGCKQMVQILVSP